MFRATADRTPDGPVLRFEGQLIGAWVNEGEIAWRVVDTEPVGSATAIVVDLRDVSMVDAAGTALLQRMYRRGARFTVRGCEMRELIREITEAADIPEGTRA